MTSEKLSIARIIYESDYLTPEQKLGLIREIKEASGLDTYNKMTKGVMNRVVDTSSTMTGGLSVAQLNRKMHDCYDKCRKNPKTKNICFKKCEQSFKTAYAKLKK